MDIEDKKQELLEMDQALKERNWELKQRAAQVGFLYYILMKFPVKIQSQRVTIFTAGGFLRMKDISLVSEPFDLLYYCISEENGIKGVTCSAGVC